jgi:hypothetical protein
MKYSDERLEQIFDKTSGYCHLCWGRLAFSNYGQRNRRGGWNVEHSRPRALGGTDHLNNLYPAHIDCNERKSAASTRRSRQTYGRTRAPYSVTKRQQRKTENAVGTAILSGAIGGALGGPIGFIAGAVAGAIKGYDQNPDW